MNSENSLHALNLEIDRTSPVPYYAQVRIILQDAIDKDVLCPGAQLPGEPELCELFDVSRTVIRQALQEMEYQGLIIRRKGIGTFVAEPKIEESLVQRLTGFYQDMTERGYTVVTKVLRQIVAPANLKIAGLLKIKSGSDVFEMERLRYVQGEPIVMVTTYLPHALCPGIEEMDFSNRSLYAILKERYGLEIARGRRTLEAVLANERESELLEVDQCAPLMLLDSVGYLEDGTPIEYYHAVHRGDRSRFEVELIRVREQDNLEEVLEDTSDLPPSNLLEES